eukprot:GHVN01065688.1.p1 GENE.GHVN01065688.1~~GHVN01065688.1.p1  ORF type:complete len:228 (+),score=40.49 GHVN01065688.1:120-803(+)
MSELIEVFQHPHFTRLRRGKITYRVPTLGEYEAAQWNGKGKGNFSQNRDFSSWRESEPQLLGATQQLAQKLQTRFPREVETLQDFQGRRQVKEKASQSLFGGGMGCEDDKQEDGVFGDAAVGVVVHQGVDADEGSGACGGETTSQLSVSNVNTSATSSSYGQPELSTCEVIMAERSIPKVIGVRGQTVKRLQAETGASLEVGPKPIDPLTHCFRFPIVEHPLAHLFE